MLTGSKTGRVAICTCWLDLTEWDFGTGTTVWTHDNATAHTELCPGWREAQPIEATIRVAAS